MDIDEDCAKEGLRMTAELGSRRVDDEVSPPPLGAGKDSVMLSRVLLLLFRSGEFVPDSLGGVWR